MGDRAQALAMAGLARMSSGQIVSAAPKAKMLYFSIFW